MFGFTSGDPSSSSIDIADEITTEGSLVATESARLLDHDRHSIRNYDGNSQNASSSHSSRVQDVQEENIRSLIEDPEEQAPSATNESSGQDQEQAQAEEQQDAQLPQEADINQHITILTNRLRILFYTLYIPIVPLSALLILLLIQLIYTAALSPSCSHPLRAFALCSALLAVYTPNHTLIKSRLLHYSRERDGTLRPRRVRIYDRCFHMICLSYLYMDMVLVQDCNDDLVPPPDADAPDGISDVATAADFDTISSCTVTCPDLYSWFQKYDLVLRIFAAILILPLVCLPFVYIWIMRRIQTAEHLFRFDANGMGGGDRREDDYLAGNVLVKDVMEGLREVVLVNEPETETIKVVGRKDGLWHRYREGNIAKDCCICMTDFNFEEGDHTCTEALKDGDDGKDVPPYHFMERDINGNLTNSSSSRIIVQTKCQHLFHKACIGGWIGGRNWEDASSSGSTDNNRVRARRRNCPLCREDLAIDSNSA